MGYFSDVKQCLEVTGADAVMSAEGLLSNPSIFLENPETTNVGWHANKIIQHFEMGFGGGSISSLKAHLFRLWRPGLWKYPQLQSQLDLIGSVEDFNKWNQEMSSWCRIACQPYDRNLHKMSKTDKVIMTDNISRNERRRMVILERNRVHLKRTKELKKEEHAKKRKSLNEKDFT